jgi:hypothetical protein
MLNALYSSEELTADILTKLGYSSAFITVAPMRGIYLQLKQCYSARNILH